MAVGDPGPWGPMGTGGLVVFEALCTFHRKILCADRQYVTQNFDTKQAGRRIFEICVYRLGNFDEHTMTPRQDGGFFAGLKMSQLGTSQDFRHRIFLERREACRRTPTRARRTKSCEECACDYFKKPGFSHRPPSATKSKNVPKERDRARIFPGPPPAGKRLDGGCAGEPGFSHRPPPAMRKNK